MSSGALIQFVDGEDEEGNPVENRVTLRVLFDPPLVEPDGLTPAQQWAFAAFEWLKEQYENAPDAEAEPEEESEVVSPEDTEVVNA